MKHIQNLLIPLCRVLALALFTFGLSWLTLTNSTAKSDILPNPPDRQGRIETGLPLHTTQPVSGQMATQGSVANPVETVFINAIPSSDGTEVAVFATGIEGANSPIFLNVGAPGDTGGGHRRSNAMTLSGTVYIANAVGFAPDQDIEDTMSLTTTVNNQVVGTGQIDFERAFVQTAAPETIPVDNGAFSVEMPNLNTLPVDAYLLVMSTNTPPAPLPFGYSLAGNTYNLSPSGALVQSDKLMTLKLAFELPLPNNSDSHTLTVVGWNKATQTWEILEGDLFESGDNQHLTLITQRFGIYALATGPTWRDSFKESDLTGVSAREHTVWGPGDTLILSSAATSGTVTSTPITPTNAAAWGTLHFSATTSLTTGLTVDVLDTTDTPLLTNVSDGTDLSSLPPTATLKLRATLTSTVPGETPRLHEWRVNWEPRVERVYLPLVVKGGL